MNATLFLENYERFKILFFSVEFIEPLIPNNRFENI